MNFNRFWKKVRSAVTLPAFILILFLFATSADMAFPLFLSAAFHECGHLLIAKKLRIPLSNFRISLLGATLSLPSSAISYRQEWLLAAAGPAASFLLFLFGSLIPELSSVFPWSFPDAFSSFLTLLRFSSLFFGILNLFPVRGFDGSRMLSSVIAFCFGSDAAIFSERLCTGVFLILLWGLSVYLLITAEVGLRLFVFSILLFCRIFLAG